MGIGRPWRQLKNLVRRILLLDPVFLCDTCRYDYGNACMHPERPNAVECPDYKKK